MSLEVSGHPAIGYGLLVDGVDEAMVCDLALAQSLPGSVIIGRIFERGLIELHNEYLKKET